MHIGNIRLPNVFEKGPVTVKMPKCILQKNFGNDVTILKINVGCLSLASEMNGGNIRLRMTLKINVG